MIDGIDKDDIQQALSILKKGGTILYPTETVWGIGCDATNGEAIKKIFRIKKRENSKALISLVSDIDMLAKWVDDIPDAAYELMEVSDSPITIIYDHPFGLAKELMAEDGSAAIRVTGLPFAKALCRALKRPLVSTSANISGGKTPELFDEISPDIIKGVDYVCRTGQDRRSECKPSSVIKVSTGNIIKIIRR